MSYTGLGQSGPTKIVFRFDIDTELGLRRGVPALLALLAEYQVPATFFVNMGRAVSRSKVIKNFWDRAWSDKQDSLTVRPTLPVYRKLGFFGMLDALVRNPSVGCSHPSILQRIHEEGHELGLHGGRSHGTWQWGAHKFPEEQLRQEVRWGKQRLMTAVPVSPRGFSSPGWNSPSLMASVIATEGFQYLADDHNCIKSGILAEGRRLNTNLLGEPGGVGFFEAVAARGGTPETVRQCLLDKAASENHIVLYDHPAFSGGEGIDLVQAALWLCREQGIQVVTASALLAGGKSQGEAV